MERLQNTLLAYAWGSRTALADLLGRPSPSAGPEAEMWMGAHPTAPSLVCADSSSIPLHDRIQADPAHTLGDEVRRRYHGGLPFLLKVLAADAPLSMQAHPSLAQAREGFAREESAGIGRRAANRNYTDPNHKPEILCALGPFDALCGFRRSAETAELLAALSCAALAPLIETLRCSPGPPGVRAAFEHLMTMAPKQRPGFLDEVLGACRMASSSVTTRHAEISWALDLAARYPGDIGAVSSLLLNLVHLEAGEAIYLPAGNLHAYLRGVGIELMANSDNVLRGGLTPKHVDVAELLRVLDFADAPATTVATRPACEHEREYVTPAPDFRLSTIELRDASAPCRPARRGPELLLCVAGRAHATVEGSAPLTLERGESVFVPAGDGRYALTGSATLFRATVGTLE